MVRLFSSTIENGNGAEMLPAIVQSETITGDAPLRLRPFFLPLPSYSPKYLCER